MIVGNSSTDGGAMAEQQFYELVFKGELVKGAELSLTKQNMGKLFKIAPEKVDALFVGRSITLKKGLDFEAAMRYRAAIKRAGARVDLIATEAEAQPITPIRGAAQHELPGHSSSGFSIRPVGENLVDESELHHERAVSVDITGLSLAPAGEEILRPEERKKTQVINLNTEMFSLAGEPDAK